MAIAVKDNTVYAVEIEVTEGTYVAPSADTSYVQTLSDGAELVPAKETLERNVLNGSIGKTTPLTSTRSSTGSLPVEMRAGGGGGSAPEYDKLLRAGMGLRRTVLPAAVDATDSGGTHTTTRAYLPDSEAGVWAIGDILTVKRAGAYHTSPVIATSDTPGDVYIDILIPMGSAFIDTDALCAVTTYVTANSGHPTLSISKYIEAAILEQATGARVSSISLENFTTGQLANFNFGFEGLDWATSVTAQPHTPAFNDTQPTIILNACLFQV